MSYEEGDKMKQYLTTKGIFLLTVTVLLFGSCLSLPPAKISMNGDIPQEKSAIVMVCDDIVITELNGVDVEHILYPKNARRNLLLTIPAGETHFNYNMHWTVSTGQVSSWIEGKDLKFLFNFEAGKEYTVGYYAKYVGSFFNPRYELYLAVWDCVYRNATPDRSHEKRIIKQWFAKVF